ncbi:hypothetical protein A3194_05455 [Candidatus Thiodiazotropha endoloripes]|nr:hypothetical protein A3194_05455 [Candidatus Thiodiazotropha endoloripes]
MDGVISAGMDGHSEADDFFSYLTVVHKGLIFNHGKSFLPALKDNLSIRGYRAPNNIMRSN